MYRVGERRCNKGGLMPALYAGLQVIIALMIISIFMDMNNIFEVLRENVMNGVLLAGFIWYIGRVNTARLKVIERQGV